MVFKQIASSSSTESLTEMSNFLRLHNYADVDGRFAKSQRVRVSKAMANDLISVHNNPHRQRLQAYRLPFNNGRC